jgi:hypothetical protein
MAENLASCPELAAGQDVVLPLTQPIKSSGHLQILYGNLAPNGSVAKITGKEGLKFTGQVCCVCCAALCVCVCCAWLGHALHVHTCMRDGGPACCGTTTTTTATTHTHTHTHTDTHTDTHTHTRGRARHHTRRCALTVRRT